MVAGLGPGAQPLRAGPGCKLGCKSLCGTWTGSKPLWVPSLAAGWAMKPYVGPGLGLGPEANPSEEGPGCSWAAKLYVGLGPGPGANPSGGQAGPQNSTWDRDQKRSLLGAKPGCRLGGKTPHVTGTRNKLLQGQSGYKLGCKTPRGTRSESKPSQTRPGCKTPCGSVTSSKPSPIPEPAVSRGYRFSCKPPPQKKKKINPSWPSVQNPPWAGTGANPTRGRSSRPLRPQGHEGLTPPPPKVTPHSQCRRCPTEAAGRGQRAKRLSAGAARR